MSTQFFKRSVLARVVSFAIIFSFIFTGMPLLAYSPDIAAVDNLRPSAAKNKGTTASDIARDLKGDLNEKLVVMFSEIGKNNVSVAGGKGANLGELLQFVKEVSVPNGIAVTTRAYREHIKNGLVDIEGGKKITLQEFIDERLQRVENAEGGYENSMELSFAAQDIRNAIEKSEMPAEVRKEIEAAYNELCPNAEPVAVRSSATAEDTADASFAGQQDTYLNMIGVEQVVGAVRRNWASLFTDRAIYYRHQNNFDHGRTYLSAVIQRMVYSKVAGTAFTVEVGTGFPVYKIDGSYGLGEAVVSGTATPDTWILDKKFRLLRKDFGSKLQKFVPLKKSGVTAKEGIEKVDTSYEERHQFCLTDAQVKMVAKACEAIEKHYGIYMDIEWAFDDTGKLWILQARPETVWSKWEADNHDIVKMENTVIADDVASKARVLLSGVVGARAAAGKAVIIDSSKEGPDLARELEKVQKDDIMIATMTTPDMVPAMKRAGAIITDDGGPTCHAAIVARELKVPCIVGTRFATTNIKEGDLITVDANKGRVYDTALPVVAISDNVHIPSLPVTKTRVGVIVASPFLAMSVYGLSRFPSHYGSSLVRKEFVDTTEIKIHPLAGMVYDKYKEGSLKDAAEKKWVEEKIINDKELKLGETIENTINGYNSYREFYIDKLANAVALIAAAQTGGQRVKFRTTDFKTNEYRDQAGGILFEPHENNPMMGNRGIYRMLSLEYTGAFEMELEAIAKAREIQPNIDVMFPVVRTVEEMEEAAALMAKHGLFKGDNPCQLGIMVEVAANVILADEFFSKLAELAKKYNTKAFMSIGSNDLTQFTLAIGRDNDKMRIFANEANPAVKRAIEIVIKTAKKYGITTGLCGQRPSNDPAFAGFLVECGIDSIGVVPEVYKNVVMVVAEQEKELAQKGVNPEVRDFTMPAKLSMGTPQRVAAVEVDAADVIKSTNIHPRILMDYDAGEIKDPDLRKEVEDKIGEKNTAKDYVINKVALLLTELANKTPDDVPIIYSTDDSQKYLYVTLLGGNDFEPFDENPQIGFNGLARVVDPDYQEFSLWQFEGVKKAREITKRDNIGIKLDLVRTLDEVSKVKDLLGRIGLVPGKDGFKIGMELDILSNTLILDYYINSGISFLTENKDRYLSYVFAEDYESDYIQIPAERKEQGWVNSQKVWTNIAEAKGVPMVSFEGEVLTMPGPVLVKEEGTQATEELSARSGAVSRTPALQADLSPQDGIAYMATSVGIENFVYTLKHSRMGKGQSRSIIIGANAIMENAGTMTTLAMFSGTAKIIAYADNKATAERLEDMGVREVVDSIVVKGAGEQGLVDFVVGYGKEGATALITAPQDREGYNLKGLRDYDVVLVNLKSPKAEEGKINSMPMAVARAFAGLLRNDNKVADDLKAMSQTHNTHGRLSADEFKSVNEIDFLT
ncbi:MAG: phosphoenolpyruvate synthase, partial [Candidatus Omnitrophota bacterium]